MGFIVNVAAALWAMAVAAVQAVFWSRYAWKQGKGLLASARHAKEYAAGADLLCPRGHVVPTEGAFECSGCHFTYEGSVWLCPNPECPAPTAPFTTCPTCSLSIRNPGRWGGH